MSDRPITREAAYAASAAWWIVIVSSPHISFATLALLLGISLLLNGLAMVALGWAMHTLRQAAPSFVSDAGVHA